MAELNWNAPRTEEGLLQVMQQLAACRAAGDGVETGRGLLSLSYLVKWVRSDTADPPFVRSHTLAMEALDVFRRAGDEKGQVRALIAASALLVPPDVRESMLSEAESLAHSLGEDDLVASVLGARARALAMSDRAAADRLQHRALEIYRRTANRWGVARTLFSLAIGEGDSAQKRDAALEAAQHFRALGEFGEASQCVQIALMNAEQIQALTDLEGIVREGLEDALKDGDRTAEGSFYERLAFISLAKGNEEDANRYRRWSAELDDADGRTPLERWKESIETTKAMIAMAKAEGSTEAMKAFQSDLKRLKASKPMRNRS